MRVALYARYSSDSSERASIADQLRVCREFAERQGWTVVRSFKDAAISGCYAPAARHSIADARCR